MGARAVAKWPKPPQKCELLFPEQGYIDERLGLTQHRKQAQQQHLVEPINHFSGLAGVRQILEVIQKNKRFATRRKYPRIPIHRVLRKRIRGSRQIQHLSALSRAGHPCN